MTKLEENLNFLGNGRQPYFLAKKATSISREKKGDLKMEDDLNVEEK